MTDDLVKRLRSAADGYYAGVKLNLTDAADRIEQLERALAVLLDEAEDTYVCMADAVGIDRHKYPMAFQIARNALKERADD